jgi:uncharacterized protein YdhG (YjbR/CyaY superfamily)
MGTRDPRVDAYIEQSAEFARPILKHLRQVIHSACPTVHETIEWLLEAKTEATRQRRLASAVEWIAAGKSRHWKYQQG